MLDISQNTVENETIDEISTIDDIDYSKLTKKELKSLFEKTIKENDLIEQYNIVKKIKNYVDIIVDEEKNAALQKFIEEGGVAEDFEYRQDSFAIKLNEVYSKLKAQYQQHLKDLQHKKEQNFKIKTEILAQMKALIEGSSVGKSGYEKFKNLQAEWKNTGPVSIEKSQELWNSYHALVNRFYDLRSINFELLDLDRKKNLESKNAIIEKAEKLVSEPSIKKALKELETLHEEFKHIGPVAKELQEEVWNRFKLASDKIHERKREYIESQKAKYEQSLAAKTAIIAKLNAAAQFTSDKIEEWVSQTKVIEAIQNEWKAAGLVEKSKVKEINKQYWDALKKFYNAKRLFFKDIEKAKNENLKLKLALIERAEALLQSADNENATKEIIDLQKQWKTIGHVPIKQKDKVYDRFKKACDAYFNKIREEGKQKSLEAKRLVEDKIQFVDAFEKADDSAFATFDSILVKIAEFKNLPQTTGAETAKIYTRFANVVKQKLRNIKDASEQDKDNLVTRLLTEALQFSPDGEKEKIAKEKNLRKEIREVEDAIAKFKNNLEFFSRSKNADAIKKEFEQKIEVEEQKLKLLKSRLSILVNN